MHVQIAILKIDRQLQPLAAQRREQRRVHVQIHRVAELVNLRRAAGLDAGSHIARVVRAEARTAQRPQQILQRLVAQEVDALVGDLDLHFAVALAAAPAVLRLGVDVAFVHQLLHQAIQKLIDLLAATCFPAAGESARRAPDRTFRRSEIASSSARFKSSSVC